VHHTNTLDSINAWIAVHKQRQLVNYRVSRTNRIAPVASSEDLSHGCSKELAHITVNGDLWWSLCFEAFGGRRDPKETLLLAAQHLFDNRGVLPLDARDSIGYPHWLEWIQQRS
jgi:hypothetical protein